MSCAVEIVHGLDGRAKRVLLDGAPVPGLLKVQTASGPRSENTVVLTLHASGIVSRVEG